jgi:hypothetical protein
MERQENSQTTLEVDLAADFAALSRAGWVVTS